MLLRCLPWKWLVRYFARQHGFMDPFAALGQFERFAQQSEVSIPVELLRAGILFQIRGLMNTKAIQMNLDWIWPYWVQRQYDPDDVAFVPRAFSATHINLTHRNWTAIGLPGCDALPIVDPRGLLTPYYDGWSLDAWLIAEDGTELLPSRAAAVSQQFTADARGLGVVTAARLPECGFDLETRASVERLGRKAVCLMDVTASAPVAGWLAIALRPFNPEGVSFIRTLQMTHESSQWHVDGAGLVGFDVAPGRHVTSSYLDGDVHCNLLNRPQSTQVRCDVGLATAAALFRLEPERARRVRARIDLTRDPGSQAALPAGRGETWQRLLQQAARLEVPDERMRFLYQAALRTVLLLSPCEVFPGPFTYKRFWFRDAVIMLHALLCLNQAGHVEPILHRFPDRLTMAGHFKSQDGEWDSNGQVLWLLWRFVQLAGRALPRSWRQPILSAARWIEEKREPRQLDRPHAGLLPAGFSAEHLGNNDHYYWDDFWGVAGLRAAARLCEIAGSPDCGPEFSAQAEDLLAAIDRSLQRTASRRSQPGIPASPYRRMDAGAIGSLVGSYPLQLFAEDDPLIAETADFLFAHCFRRGAFFQDIIHSGLNAYLSLHVAQVMLRAGDARFWGIVQAVADLASPTGQWPEAIHPQTGGGCMGDGQHGWASAEWLLMLRNMFVREEPDRLILASGLPDLWLAPGGQPLRFGPTLTPYGPVTVQVRPDRDQLMVSWTGDWRKQPPTLEVRLPGRAPKRVAAPETRECAFYWNSKSHRYESRDASA